MLIIDVKDGDSIDKALKKYKRKYQRVGILRELRDRKQYTKPSVEKREQRLNAKYREQYLQRHS